MDLSPTFRLQANSAAGTISAVAGFSTNLKRLREAAGLTQRDLAEAMNTHSPTISDWENEEKHNDPLLSTLLRLAGPLHCTPSDLIATDPSAESAPAPSLAETWGRLSEVDKYCIVQLINHLAERRLQRAEFHEWDHIERRASTGNQPG